MKKAKPKEVFIVLVVAAIVFSALVYFVYFSNNQKSMNPIPNTTITTTIIEAQKTSADIIPKQSDTPMWTLTEIENVTINSTGFVEGSKARFSKDDPPATIVSRIEVYAFETEEATKKFYIDAVNEAKNDGYDEIDLSYDIECYANSFYQDGVSRYNLHCHDKNIYFVIKMIGVKTEDSSKYASEFFVVLKKLVSK